MIIKCVTIDDEPLALDILRAYIKKIPALQLVQEFDDAISASEFIKINPVDLLFVDIQMPDISGVDLVRSLEVKPVIIFTTAHKNFAYEGFELEALDYLLKPIDFERFGKSVNKAIEYLNNKNNKPEETSESIYVYSEYKLIKILLNEIDYIESFEDYVKIHLLEEKPILTLNTMKKMLEKLPEKDFRRIHRSYIVPVNKIISIHNKKVHLKSGRELPIGDSYAGFVQDWKAE
jgi:two-component system, LytTR family, response regulator